jgi:putative tryptophan/tyrosine transport system substrate-binding protein
VQRVQELGWTAGRNVRIDYRWAAAERSRAQTLAHELIELQPDVIVACGGPAAIAVAQATRCHLFAITAERRYDRRCRE